MRNNVFIVGNGFDLDLGLPTRYSDFAKSNYWPKEQSIDVYRTDRTGLLDPYAPQSLASYLNEKINIETWFDLEHELLNYAQGNITSVINGETAEHIKNNVDYYKLLQIQLCDYIKFVQDNIQKGNECVATKVLEAVVNNGFFTSIYSFNYTNLPTVVTHINGRGIKSVKCIHIHGCVDDNSIILGVDEQKIRHGYEAFLKTSSKYYKSHDLYNTLSHSKEVVIFGLSFGDIDYSYFDRFFKQISQGNSIEEKDKQYITIFTKDDDSRMSILNQLRKMEINMQRLYAQSHFQIICTEEDYYKDALQEFFNRLDKYSERNRPRISVL
ncbi:MAG: hypothetical protein J6I41_09325 [Bacteroidales bacterium]|nr:hypothetical protein [Bacteroidales bacterium]